MRFLKWAAIVLASIGVPQMLAQDTVRIHKPRIVLVELFTSEGCSSCPPADLLLQRIDGKQFSPDALIVGLSEHVTYWDNEGWKDPFGSELATARQQTYGQRFHLEEVYTPQMVVNGERQFVGSDAHLLEQALALPPAPAMQLNITGTKLDGNAVNANAVVLISDTAAAQGTGVAQGAELFAVIAEDEKTERVSAGENRGKTLAHTSVARTLVRVGHVSGAGSTELHLPLPPSDAGTHRHLIVWVQEAGLGRVLAVDSVAF
jgi:hypothetical protein